MPCRVDTSRAKVIGTLTNTRSLKEFTSALASTCDSAAEQPEENIDKGDIDEEDEGEDKMAFAPDRGLLQIGAEFLVPKGLVVSELDWLWVLNASTVLGK